MQNMTDFPFIAVFVAQTVVLRLVVIIHVYSSSIFMHAWL